MVVALFEMSSAGEIFGRDSLKKRYYQIFYYKNIFITEK
jgi:hypothetical protein